MKHTLPPLPFARHALEPYMSRETLDYHYGKHHQAYLDKLNKLIIGTEYEELELQQIVINADGPIFNNAAQAWNHEFFWHCLSPKRSEPQGELSKRLNDSFGSVEKFQTDFSKSAIQLFGSGWTWLVRKDDGLLEIVQTHDAETPISEGHVPILTCDVWEHAYYIDHRNERPKYLASFFSIVDWEKVAQRLGESSGVIAQAVA